MHYFGYLLNHYELISYWHLKTHFSIEQKLLNYESPYFGFYVPTFIILFIFIHDISTREIKCEKMHLAKLIKMFTSNCILLNLNFNSSLVHSKNTVHFKGHSSLSAHHLKIELRIRKLKYSFYLHAIPIKIEKLSLREMFFSYRHNKNSCIAFNWKTNKIYKQKKYYQIDQQFT